eukprot:CAMPEP_0195030378 /NCGR_PEP_ID=MMETSP0326_2-20130528/58790_1 /TAXON_ID=2866 ORGANISM="Crypthecodinium cohnii, Strain Seligo" /NCGR_SAMPLE_ID=MMETSP0326_2 /ASSEMBLY_ACC=CAM_ASM_000348 /LENGTH=30 /DNA_ID= /DNA_START= /DNA_END= /DNA_ORIENTATION=
MAGQKQAGMQANWQCLLAGKGVWGVGGRGR